MVHFFILAAQNCSVCHDTFIVINQAKIIRKQLGSGQIWVIISLDLGMIDSGHKASDCHFLLAVCCIFSKAVHHVAGSGAYLCLSALNSSNICMPIAKNPLALLVSL